jgi:Tol biopolymer transport system component
MNSDGSDQKKLAEGMDIALSPYGSKVFFYREKQDNGWELWVMNSDGSNLQKLSQVNADSIEDLQNPESGISLHSWSPDRKNIIFYTTKRVFSDYSWIQNEDGTLEKGKEIGTRKYGEIISTLWMWNVDGNWSKARKIISSKPLTEEYVLPHISIVWNPDGNSFIFSFLDIVEGRIQAPIYNATLAYDGREMLTSIQGGVNESPRTQDIWQPRISMLTTIGGVIDIGALSPDGKNILFSHWIRQSITTAGGEIWMMNVDGSGGGQLTNSSGSMWGKWSPDGKKIAYLSYSGNFGWFGDKEKNYEESSQIWVMNADGSEKQRLISIPFPYGVIWSDLHWNPDGSKLAFGWTANLVGARSDIYLLDVPATMKKETS